MSYEINYRLSVDAGGVIVSDESEALAARVGEWLDTPQGQVWGAPSWGNRLMQYKHEPINAGTASAIENSIMLTLPVDVKGAVIQAIEVSESASDMDMYLIKIKVNGQSVTRGLRFE